MLMEHSCIVPFLSPSITKAIRDNQCAGALLPPYLNLHLGTQVCHLIPTSNGGNGTRLEALRESQTTSCRNVWIAVLIFGCTYFVRKGQTIEGTGSSFSYVVCIF